MARGDVLASLGVDTEPHAPPPAGMIGEAALPDERRHLARPARDHPQVGWERVPFSAKGSVCKAWFPLTGRWLGFLDRTVAPDPDSGTFTAVLRVPGPGRRRTRACLICLRGHQVARQLDAHGREISAALLLAQSFPAPNSSGKEFPHSLARRRFR